MIYTSTSPPHPYNNSSFHIWVSFRSQNPMVPWTTPPFINNKSFPFYLLSLSLSLYFIFKPSQTRQPQLSPSTRPVPCNSDTTYVPSTWGSPDPPNTPFHSHLSSIHYSTRHPPTLSLTLPTTHHHISSSIITWFSKSKMLSRILTTISNKYFRRLVVKTKIQLTFLCQSNLRLF